jgi:hypothetical protein
MKRVLLFFCLLFSATSAAQAHDQPPIEVYVQGSQTVCIAKATSIDKGVVTFSVEEIVKGKPPASLQLKTVGQAFPVGSEWLLAEGVDHGYGPNSVGWVLKGDCAWVDAPVQRISGKIHLVGDYGFVSQQLAADPTKGLDLDQLRALAQKPVSKN